MQTYWILLSQQSFCVWQVYMHVSPIRRQSIALRLSTYHSTLEVLHEKRMFTNFLEKKTVLFVLVSIDLKFLTSRKCNKILNWGLFWAVTVLRFQHMCQNCFAKPYCLMCSSKVKCNTLLCLRVIDMHLVMRWCSVLTQHCFIK